MRTRSGRDVGNREAGRTDDMADDNHSTEARWGTPAHTASFSTIASHHRPSLSPRSAGNGQQQYPQPSQNADEASSTHSPYVATPPNRFSVSPLGDHPQQQGQDYFNNPTTTETHYPPAPAVYQPPHSQPYHLPYPPLQLTQPQHYPTTQEPESIRRYSTEGDPWNPAAQSSPPPGQGENTSLKRRFSGYDDEFGEVTMDRQYPDKIEEELENLAQKEGKAEGERDKKRKKTRGRRSRPRGRGGRKDRERDDYPDDGGEGMGGRA